MNYYQQQLNNPYVGYQPQRFQTPDQQYVNQMQNQQMQQPIQPPIFKSSTAGLQGKSVDSIDVVKAMDIPLDFSVSYFPLADGSAIVTKQVQADGTSKMIIYKPSETDVSGKEDNVQYLTIEEFNEKIKNLDNNKDLKDEIKSLKKQIKSLTDELEDLKEKED